MNVERRTFDVYPPSAAPEATRVRCSNYCVWNYE